METWQKIIKLNSTESTNAYCIHELKEKKLPEGTIISALYQSNGKGLDKNSWESEKGKNLLFSLILYPEFVPVENQFLISKTISLGIVNYIQAKTNHIKIKWPNDIYYKNKKLSGILIENTVKGSQINQCVVGVGFNLNQEKFNSDAPNPISLNQITEKNYSLDQEIIKLRNNIRFFYDKLKAGKYSEINADYLKCLYQFNEFKTYKSNDELFTAKITGVNEFGHLQVQTEKGENKEFDLKEIEFIV